jgi:hypothetical protein
LQEPGSVERFGIDALVGAVSGLLPAGQQAEGPGLPAAVVERIELRPDRSTSRSGERAAPWETERIDTP